MKKATEVQKLLGKRIKETRDGKKMSQEKLAEKVGISDRNMSKIECEASFVRAETLERIAAALEVEIQDLFNYNHLKDVEDLKAELIDAINSDKVDVQQMYRFYQSIKK